MISPGSKDLEIRKTNLWIQRCQSLMSDTKDSHPKTKPLKDHPDKDKEPKDVVP
jgi:hypothetical protein